MSDTTIGLPEAAHHLGVPVRVLRRAIFSGKIPAPPHLSATSPIPAEWLDTAKAAVEALPKALVSVFRQKEPAFARYRGTSAWRKYTVRVREFTAFHAAK